jgi:hypothetical protein
MTAGSVLAGTPSSEAIHAVAPSVYREVVTGSSTCRSVSYHGAFERLELCEGKLPCTVLRGRGPAMAPCYPTDGFARRHNGAADASAALRLSAGYRAFGRAVSTCRVVKTAQRC